MIRISNLGNRLPEDIPVAGVTLRDLFQNEVEHDELFDTFVGDRKREAEDLLQPDDKVWKFKTPKWTWGTMSGMEGYVILRDGLAVCWIITRMN